MPDHPHAPFPWRALAGFAAGFVLVLGFAHRYPRDPFRELPKTAYSEEVFAAIEALPERASGETRIFVVGASETMGYPYVDALDASYATLLGDGLAAALPDQRIVVCAAASTALDSERLVEIVGRIARQRPTAIVVTLGNGEYSNRIVSGVELDPSDLLSRYAEHMTRSRELWARLPLPRDPLRERRVATANVEGLPARIVDARPAEPAFPGLPVGKRDRDRIELRLRQNLRNLVQAARAKDARVVLAIAPYDLTGAWPFGMTGQVPAIDALVLRAQRGAEVALAEVDALVDQWPGRADLWFLRGRVLRKAGDTMRARDAFERARDLDPAPLHATSSVEHTIQSEAKALGVPCLRLVLPLLEDDDLSSSKHFLDHAHLDLFGHQIVAGYLAAQLATAGIVPPLPAGWTERFKVAAAARHARIVPESQYRARMRTVWTQAVLMMLCGNFRDALFQMRVGLAEMARPENRAFGEAQLATCAREFLYCLFALADRVADGQARSAHWFQRLRAAFGDESKLDALIDEVLR